MKVCIGTCNKAKVAAVEKAFQSNHLFIPLEVDSGVNNQPFSDEETIQGSINRAKNALKQGQGDIGIGLEGGVHPSEHGLFLCNWGALATKDGKIFIAGGAKVLLPAEIAEQLLKKETELGHIIDEFAGKQNVSKKEGAIGILTNGRIDRSNMFQHIVEMLLGQYEYSIQS